ncbi:uncharacterized protein G2W53_008660 [Senna tora]|uniref:Uncharacterized protein n=1 Tax=Senna tora TaxID=362788 RepID=A0A834XAK1_9FABA|nr:uncharacterized protein G2W53_008660 [Senna tora]
MGPNEDGNKIQRKKISKEKETLALAKGSKIKTKEEASSYQSHHKYK